MAVTKVHRPTIDETLYSVQIENGGTSARSADQAAENIGLITESMVDKQVAVLSSDQTVQAKNYPLTIQDSSLPIFFGETSFVAGTSLVVQIANYDANVSYVVDASRMPNTNYVLQGDEITLTAKLNMQSNEVLVINGREFHFTIISKIVQRPVLINLPLVDYGSYIEVAGNIPYNLQHFVSSAFSETSGTLSHAYTVWAISKVEDFSQSELTENRPEYKLDWPAGPMVPSTIYYLTFAHVGSDGTMSAWSPKYKFTTAQMAVIFAPFVTSPRREQTGVALSPLLQSDDPYCEGFNPVHLATDWQIATDADFTNLVLDVREDTVHLQSYQFQGTLNYDSLYYVRCRYRFSEAAYNGSPYSDWSRVNFFMTTPDYRYIEKPILNAIPGNPASMPMSWTASASDFLSVYYTDQHVSSDWELRKNYVPGIGYSEVAWASYGDTINKTSIPITLPEYGTEYSLWVRYNGNVKTSEWSDLVVFSSMADNRYVETPTAILVSKTNDGQGIVDLKLSTTAFTPVNYSEAHVASRWQMATDPDFTNVVVDSGWLAASEYVVPSRIAYSTQYYARVILTGAIKSSAWSAALPITIEAGPVFDKPVVLIPGEGALYVELTTTFQGSDFAAYNFAAANLSPQLVSVDWEVSYYGSGMVWQKYGVGLVYSNTDLPLPDYGTNYGVRCRWRSSVPDKDGSYYSDWSDWRLFQTKADDRYVTTPTLAVGSYLNDGSGIRNLQLSSSPWEPHGYIEPQTAVRWQIATEPTFASPAIDTGWLGQNFNTISIEGPLAYATTYYARVQYSGTIKATDWSAPVSFVTDPVPVIDTPVIYQPGQGSTQVSRTPEVLSTAFSASWAGLTHDSTEWVIENVLSGLVAATGSYGLTRYQDATTPLGYNTQYRVRCRYRANRAAYNGSAYSEWSAWVYFTTVEDTRSIQKPTISLGGWVNNTTSLNNLTLNASAFVPVNYTATHAASYWQVATDPGFENLILDSGWTSAHLTSITFTNPIPFDSTLYARVNFSDGALNSEWSTPISFHTDVYPVIVKPTITNVVFGSDGNQLTVTFSSTAFQTDGFTATHISSDWDFTNPVFGVQSGIDKTSITLPFAYGTTFTARVRYNANTVAGNGSATSEWSEWVTFTTPADNRYIDTPTVTAVSLTNTILTVKDMVITASPYHAVNYNGGQTGSRWQVAYDPDFQNIVLDSGAANAVNTYTFPGNAAFDFVYYIRVLYTDAYKTSAWSPTYVYTSPTLPRIEKPHFVWPASGASNIDVNAIVTASPFTTHGFSPSHVSTDWEFSVSSDFSTVKQTSYADSMNLESYRINIQPLNVAERLDYSTLYFARVRYKASTAAQNGSVYSEWSDPIQFQTMADNRSLAVPTLAAPGFPADNWTGFPVSGGTLQISNPVASNFNMSSAYVQWQTATDPGFVNLVRDTALSTAWPNWGIGDLAYGTRYYVRARFIGVDSLWPGREVIGPWSGTWILETIHGWSMNATIYTQTDYNFYWHCVSSGWNGSVPVFATVTVDGNSTISAGSSSNAAVYFPSYSYFPNGVTLDFYNYGIIRGAPGQAGKIWQSWGVNGTNGGPAFYNDLYNAKFTNYGVISGGGGGGGLGGGRHDPSGDALHTAGSGGSGGYAIALGAVTWFNNAGYIFGGGGGGGGGAWSTISGSYLIQGGHGGGGAGFGCPGAGADSSEYGIGGPAAAGYGDNWGGGLGSPAVFGNYLYTTLAGCNGGNGASLGNYASPGSPGVVQERGETWVDYQVTGQGSGGAPGYSIINTSNLSYWVDSGTVYGPMT
jgi:hypothetical protein